MTLKEGVPGNEYVVRSIETQDKGLNAFLFSLGCYSGENITLISKYKSGCIVAIKDGRYTVDNDLAHAIKI